MEETEMPPAPPPGVRVMDICVPDTANFLARYDQRLLGRIVVLAGRAFAHPSGSWSGQLCRGIRRTRRRFVLSTVLSGATEVPER